MLAGGAGASRILGLTSDDWTVVAAVAQALAAFGAIALLAVTWLSQRDSRKALETAQSLASRTGALARAAWTQLEVSTRPVIQVTYEPHAQRLRLTNKGNGPLLAPRVRLAGEQLSVVSSDSQSSSFVETAAFAVAEDAFALMTTTDPPAGDVTISGWTVAGADFEVHLDGTDFVQRTALVARSAPSEDKSLGG